MEDVERRLPAAAAVLRASRDNNMLNFSRKGQLECNCEAQKCLVLVQMHFFLRNFLLFNSRNLGAKHFFCIFFEPFAPSLGKALKFAPFHFFSFDENLLGSPFANEKKVEKTSSSLLSSVLSFKKIGMLAKKALQATLFEGQFYLNFLAR